MKILGYFLLALIRTGETFNGLLFGINELITITAVDVYEFLGKNE